MVKKVWTYGVLSTRGSESLRLSCGVGDGSWWRICLEDGETRARVHHRRGLCGDLCSGHGLNGSVLDEAGLEVVGYGVHLSTDGGGASGSSSSQVVGSGKTSGSTGTDGCDACNLSSAESASHTCETETLAVDDVLAAVDADRNHLQEAREKVRGIGLNRKGGEDVLSVSRGFTSGERNGEGDGACSAYIGDVCFDGGSNCL